MKNKKPLSITTGLLTVFASLLFVNQANAANSTITAIPPRLEIEVEPGETVKSILKVRNETSTQQNFSVNVEDFIVDQKTNTPIPLSENVTSRWSLRKWIISPKIIPVDAGATQNVEITIRVPASALPGGHYAMVTYNPNGEIKPGDLRKTATIIGQRVGSIIYVKVKGDINEKAYLNSFTSPKFTEKGPVEFLGALENASDIHINPKGYISIKDLFNREVSRINLDLGNIFPENIKEFSTKWDQKWGYGRYTAELNLVYGSDNVVSGLIYFWLFPITGIIYTLIAIVSILAIIIILNKRNKKHQENLEATVKELQKEIDLLEKK